MQIIQPSGCQGVKAGQEGLSLTLQVFGMGVQLASRDIASHIRWINPLFARHEYEPAGLDALRVRSNRRRAARVPDDLDSDAVLLPLGWKLLSNSRSCKTL
jgi:hypothetical protein